ncbi:MAG: glycosyltransferase, partial [Muribaculaceae bacterium]|nr:glycosyltransferase [Muribaculaceae bacterium]
MLKVLLAGGGTGGHINPALAIASIIKEHHPDAEFLFAGTPNGMEARLIPKEGYNFAPIKISGFQRKITPKNLVRDVRAAAYLAASGHRAHKIIADFSPDIVIGTGGYVSYPILAKAVQMGIPTAIHEQNAFPGITNRLLSKKVDAVMLTVEEAAGHLDPAANYTVTGLPVRAGFSGGMSRAEAKKQLGLDDSICIFSFGGSLGAGAINKGAAALMKWEKE